MSCDEDERYIAQGLDAQCAADFPFHVFDVERGFVCFEAVDHATSVIHVVFFVDLHFFKRVACVVAVLFLVVQFAEVLQVQFASVLDVSPFAYINKKIGRIEDVGLASRRWFSDWDGAKRSARTNGGDGVASLSPP